MNSLEELTTDFAFLDDLMRWLKTRAHPEHYLIIGKTSIEVWKHNQKTAPSKIANFKNANQFLEWIRSNDPS